MGGSLEPEFCEFEKRIASVTRINDGLKSVHDCNRNASNSPRAEMKGGSTSRGRNEMLFTPLLRAPLDLTVLGRTILVDSYLY